MLFAGESAALSAAKIGAEDAGKGFTKAFESARFQFGLDPGGALGVEVGLENTIVEHRMEIFPMVFTPFAIETEIISFGPSLNFENRLFPAYARGAREITVSLPDYSAAIPVNTFSETIKTASFAVSHLF